MPAFPPVTFAAAESVAEGPPHPVHHLGGLLAPRLGGVRAVVRIERVAADRGERGLAGADHARCVRPGPARPPARPADPGAATPRSPVRSPPPGRSRRPGRRSRWTGRRRRRTGSPFTVIGGQTSGTAQLAATASISETPLSLSKTLTSPVSGFHGRDPQPRLRPLVAGHPRHDRRSPLRLRHGPGPQRGATQPGTAAPPVTRDHRGEDEPQQYARADRGVPVAARVGELAGVQLGQRRAAR